MRAYRLTGDSTGPRLTLVSVEEPSCGAGEVVVEIAAVSLNYRDLLVAPTAPGLIPLSDGAGTIVRAGPGVDPQRIGERVVIGFMPGWIAGAFQGSESGLTGV